VDMWVQLVWCVPCHMSGNLVYTYSVMALAWFSPLSLTQEVNTSIIRLTDQISTTVVTILEEAGLL
jgi:hypothetical protein